MVGLMELSVRWKIITKIGKAMLEILIILIIPL